MKEWNVPEIKTLGWLTTIEFNTHAYNLMILIMFSKGIYLLVIMVFKTQLLPGSYISALTSQDILLKLMDQNRLMYYKGKTVFSVN